MLFNQFLWVLTTLITTTLITTDYLMKFWGVKKCANDM